MHDGVEAQHLGAGKGLRPLTDWCVLPSLQIFEEAKTLLPGGVNSPVRAFRSVGGQPIVFDHVKGAYCWDVDNNKYIDYVGATGRGLRCLRRGTICCVMGGLGVVVVVDKKPANRPDFVSLPPGSWGPAIVGHANDEVNDALRKQLEKGTSFGETGLAAAGVFWMDDPPDSVCQPLSWPRTGAPCELENILAKMVIERVPSVEMVRFVSSGELPDQPRGTRPPSPLPRLPRAGSRGLG